MNIVLLSSDKMLLSTIFVFRISYNFNIFLRERYVRGRQPNDLSFPMIGVHSGWSDLNRDGKFYQESC